MTTYLPSKSDPTVRATISGGLETVISDIIKLTDNLLNLCNFPLGARQNTLSISKDFRNLQRMTPVRIIIPVTATMTVTLPSSTKKRGLEYNYQPFPTNPPTIEAFADEIEIMASLQKPRKITILGSDGRDYIFLCKPKDDLRKDCRLMEFNSMINMLLKKDPDARRRNLRMH